MPIATVSDTSILFIHVPKCAGMSVDQFLRDNAQVTAEARLRAYSKNIRLRHLHREPLEQLYSSACFDWVFMIVRHPVARMISEYRYQRRKGGLHPQNFTPFGLWLRFWLRRARRNPSVRENHFRPQADFLTFDAEVFQVEQGLDPFVERFSQITGIETPAPMPIKNASPKQAVHVSDADRRLIGDFFHADFAAFGYDVTQDTDSVTHQAGG